MQISGHDIRVDYITNVFISSDIGVNGLQDWKAKLEAISDKIPSKADALKPLIQFIVTTIDPSKIYMLLHRDMEAKEEYIDLLIVVPDSKGVSFTELEPILEMACLNNQRVLYSLHSEGNLVSGLKNGHIFYSLNCIPENLVYDDKTIAYPTTTPEALKTMKALVYEKFNAGLRKAQDFYESAVLFHKQHSSPVVAFMLHQAIELTYRAILRSLSGYDKKTHELRILKKHIRRCSPLLSNIFPDNTEEEKIWLDILEATYLQARYEDDYQIKETYMTLLFEKAKLFLATAEEVVKTKLTNI